MYIIGKKRLTLLCLMAILILSACQTTLSQNNLTDLSPDKPLEHYVQMLADPNNKGRLAGTAQNQLLAYKLADYFKQIGLTPLDQSYLHEYQQQFFDPDLQRYEVSVQYSDGSKKELLYGKDFITQAVDQDVSLELPITFDAEEVNGKIFITDKPDQLNKVQQIAKMVLRKGNLFKTLHQGSYTGIPILQISPSVYDELYKQRDKVKSIRVTIDLSQKMIQAHNVVGILKGGGKAETSREAVIISAHMDHVGWDSSGVYNGAIDNSTGIAVMMQLAQDLKEYSKKQPLIKDIIFIALNGEESGLKGSTAMVELLLNTYSHLFVINIDSIGAKNGGRIAVLSSQTGISTQLQDSIIQFFNQNGFDSYSLESAQSDHTSFEKKGISAVTIGNDLIFDRIHTHKDVIEQIDFPYLYRIKESIFNYIIRNYDTDFSPQEQIDENNHLSDRGEDEVPKNELSSLQLGQYKLIKEKNRFTVITQSMLNSDRLDLLHNYFPNMKIRNEIGSFFFDHYVMSLDFPNNFEEIKKLEENKIYQHPIKKEYIVNLTVFYYDKKKGEYLKISLTKDGRKMNDHNPDIQYEDLTIQSLQWEIEASIKSKQLLSATTSYQIGNLTYMIDVSKGKEYKNDKEKVYGIAPNWNKEEMINLIQTIDIPSWVEDVLK